MNFFVIVMVIYGNSLFMYAIHFPDGQIQYFPNYPEAEKELSKWKSGILLQVIAKKEKNNITKQLTFEV